MKTIKFTFFSIIIVSTLALNISIFTENTSSTNNQSICIQAEANTLPNWSYWAPNGGDFPPTWIYLGAPLGFPACKIEPDRDLEFLMHCVIHVGE